MTIVGSATPWPRHEAMVCHRCDWSTWVDPILLDHARLHRREAVVVCEGCHCRGPPKKQAVATREHLSPAPKASIGQLARQHTPASTSHKKGRTRTNCYARLIQLLL
jgi:hypothetical protein